MTPATTIMRLAVSVAFNLLALATGLVQALWFKDMGAALAMGAGLAFIGFMIAPDMGEVNRIIHALKAQHADR